MDALLPYITLSNGIGIISFCVMMYAFWQIDKARIMFFNTVSLMGLGTHYFLEGNIALAIVRFIGGIRLIAAIRYPGSMKAFLLFTAIIYGCVIYNWHGYLDILPMIGILSTSISYFFLHGIPMRLFFMLGSFLFMLSAGLTHSIPGVLSEGFALLVHTRGLYYLIKHDPRQAKISHG